jgi:putative solute:sodium symporter small subunit
MGGCLVETLHPACTGYSKWKRLIVQAALRQVGQFIVIYRKNMQLTQRHKQYWLRNLRLTGALLAIWFVVTFVVGWFARDLQVITVLGFPLSFYMGAQGAVLVYVILVWYYAYCMDKLDIEYGVQEGEL